MLKIRVVAPVTINLGEAEVVFTGLFPQFGAPHGMVVDGDADLLGRHSKEFLELGFGYSTVTVGDDSDIESAQEMLRDWGWTSAEPAPNWL